MAMVVLTAGLLAVNIMQAYFADGNSQSRQMIRATDIAMNHIEELTNITDLSNVNLNPGNSTRIIDDFDRDYMLSWNVTDNGDGTLVIDITVSWQVNGITRSVNFPWVKSI